MLSACSCELSLLSDGSAGMHSLPAHGLRRCKHQAKANWGHWALCFPRNRVSILKKGHIRRRSSISFASANEDGVIPSLNEEYLEISGSSQLEETRSKLNASLQFSSTKVKDAQALHEAARKFQLAIEQYGSLSKQRWFSKPWLGVDQFSWIKPVAYQAAVHALLQAVHQIASRGEGRDRDTHILIRRSISRQLAPLEESINQQFLTRKTNADSWFWSEQHPLAVASFIEMLESDTRFTSVTIIGWEGASITPSKASDASLVSLTISSAAAIVKLGAAKISCPPFFSNLNEEIGRLMNLLLEFVPIDQVYNFTSSVGLREQFLQHFGLQATQYRKENEIGGEEGAFWVDLVQQLLRAAISRERLQSKFTSYDSIEVLERDLAVFGFFAALGRKSQGFLLACNISNVDDQLMSFLSYLVGGSTLFYPQLTSLNTYQLFIEVVCEEMEWMPFYPSLPSLDNFHGKTVEKPHFAQEEAVSMVLDNCSRWINDFFIYSTWAGQPAGVCSKSFLMSSQRRLSACLKAYPRAQCHVALKKIMWIPVVNGPDVKSLTQGQKGLELFDKELQAVDDALSRLERLLLEREMGPGKQHLTVACTNLERIRQLKMEVEALEVALREKASTMLQEPESAPFWSQQKQKANRDGGYSLEEENLDRQQVRNRTNMDASRSKGMFKFFPFLQNSSDKWTNEMDLKLEGEVYEQTAAVALQEASAVSKEIEHFDLLRQELMDLKKRIQECAAEHQETACETESRNHYTLGKTELEGEESVKGNIFSKSLEKIKEISADVWRGTQLLATDVAAAVALIQRSASGEELTERERKMLKRTLTDLASVVPIGILMLLPVTAVGHAAILAAIQRYVPALIPSAFARERLDLIRQLEQVKEMENLEAVHSSECTTAPGTE